MPVLQVALDVPLDRTFDYTAEPSTGDELGRRVVVPFGRGERVGVVVGVAAASELPSEQLKPVRAVLRDEPPMPADWLALCRFAADYYQSSLGEVIAQALPPGLKQVRQKKARTPKAAASTTCKKNGTPPPATPEQQTAVNAVAAAFGRFEPFLLYGVTGSGKTEVYLRLVERALAGGGQVLLLVPEINLTPQLETRVAERFPEVVTVSLHSELTEAARPRSTCASSNGRSPAAARSCCWCPKST